MYWGIMASPRSLSPEQILRAIEHHSLALCPPTNSKVASGAEWLVRSLSGHLLGFGATPAAAVEDALGALGED